MKKIYLQNNTNIKRVRITIEILFAYASKSNLLLKFFDQMYAIKRGLYGPELTIFTIIQSGYWVKDNIQSNR